MSAVAVLLVLVAAVLHAGWNRLVHATDDRLAVMAVASVAAAVLLGWDVVLHPPLQVVPSVAASAAAEVGYAVAVRSTSPAEYLGAVFLLMAPALVVVGRISPARLWGPAGRGSPWAPGRSRPTCWFSSPSGRRTPDGSRRSARSRC